MSNLPEEKMVSRWQDERSDPPAPEVWIYRDWYHYPVVSFTEPDLRLHPTAVRYVLPGAKV